MGKLTVRAVQGNLKPGMHNDGGGLYLKVGPTGSRSWVLRTRVHGKQMYMGLGPTWRIGLAEAREAALQYRKIAREGGNPLAERRKADGIPTFAEAAELVWKQQIVPTAKNGKHIDQWISSLRTYAFPTMGELTVDTVTSAEVLNVLQPIWLEKSETARRVRQRLRTIFDWAIASRYRMDANPVAGIDKALARQKDRIEHHAAMPWAELPEFMTKLADAKGMGALALTFAILTAARSGEVRGATWAEIDREHGVWTVPAERMKATKEHRVPLSVEALQVLEMVLKNPSTSEYIFPGQKGQPLSDMSLTAVLRRMDVSVTAHGFRSTFRDWAGEKARARREVAEACLAHKLGDAVERSYARSDYFEERKKLMSAWGRFSSGETGAVVDIMVARA